MGEAQKVKAVTAVPMGVLAKGEATSHVEVKGGPNASFRSVEGVSSIRVDSRGKEDSQSS